MPEPILHHTVRPKVTFHVDKRGVRCTFHIAKDASISVVFESVDHMMEFFYPLMEKAAEVWPNHPLVKEYLAKD